MVDMFRSEDMEMYRLLFSRDTAHEVMSALGTFSKFHLIDLTADQAVNTDTFVYFKKRAVTCGFLERKLQRFEQEFKNFGVEVPSKYAFNHDLEIKSDVVSHVSTSVDQVESELNKNLEFLNQQTKTLNELVERRLVIETVKREFMNNSSGGPSSQGGYEMKVTGEVNQPLIDDEKGSSDQLHTFIAGAIPVLQQNLFERMLFRVSRGNAYVRFADVPEEVADPATGEKIRKAIFFVMYVGQHMTRRIEKMSDFLKATRYTVPPQPEDCDREVARLSKHIADSEAVVTQTRTAVVALLKTLKYDESQLYSPLRTFQELLRKEKLICDALRKCDSPNNSVMIRADGWCPAENANDLKQCLADAVSKTGGQQPVIQLMYTPSAPPTFFKTNKITSVFQGIVDTYGVPRYKEANPGLFTIVTFPFLFGVMYGDIGHGFVLFVASLLLIMKEDALQKQASEGKLGEVFVMAFGGRYLLVAMGFFAFYCGILYNDCFSVPINLFGSHWEFVGNSTEASPTGGVYPFGVDPLWYNTQNELTFFNSMKMKLSVTLGVIQMVFGIILGLFNHIYFHDYISIFFEFIPQMLFMLSTFGYMIFMIIFKFTVDWLNLEGRNAPNLIQTMIKMFLSPGSVSDDSKLYDGQGQVQAALVLIAVISMPWMLLTKPYILKYLHNRSLKHVGDEEHGAKPVSHGGGHGHGDGEFNFSEIIIHQSIHTIEFVLGCVSNTASYLRLWALSLAHAELANVFWSKLVMEYGVKSGSALMAFVGWGAWAGATFAVLLCMDVLECFLHALRLHWVEFQNKFFQADGYAFRPFTFEAVQED